MLSRRLVSAAVALLTAYLASPARAQNLEAGKTPSQIFSQTCSLCHKSSRGLLKSVQPGSLPGFLRQHYTTSTDMASMLSAYILSNGAADTRLGGDNLTKQGKEARSGAGPEPKRSEARSSAPSLFEELFESKPSEPKPSPAEAAKPESKPERRTREASRPDVEGLQNVPGAARSAGAEAAPPEAQQKGKKPKIDRHKPSVATLKPELNVESPPAAIAKPEPAGVPSVRPDSDPSVAPAVEEPQQRTAEEKSSNMPVFNLDPPPLEAAPSGPPRPPAGPPVVPISQ